MTSSGRIWLFCACALISVLSTHLASPYRLKKINNFPSAITKRFQEWNAILKKTHIFDKLPITENTTEAARRFFSTVWKGGKVDLKGLPGSERNFRIPVLAPPDFKRTLEVWLRRQNNLVDMDLQMVNLSWVLHPILNNTYRNAVVKLVQVIVKWPEARYTFNVSVRPDSSKDRVHVGKLDVTLRNSLLALTLASELDRDSTFCVTGAEWYCRDECPDREVKVDLSFEETKTPLTAEEETRVKDASEDFIKSRNSFVVSDFESAFLSYVKQVGASSDSKDKEDLPPNCIALQ